MGTRSSPQHTLSVGQGLLVDEGSVHSPSTRHGLPPLPSHLQDNHGNISLPSGSWYWNHVALKQDHFSPRELNTPAPSELRQHVAKATLHSHPANPTLQRVQYNTLQFNQHEQHVNK